jgi:heptosyltransferase-3
MKRGKITNRILDYYLGIPALNCAASFRAKKKLPRDVERIGLVFNHALGDTLLASGAVLDLRNQYRKQELILFAAPSNLEAARLLPEVDRIETASLLEPRRAIRTLRACNLDILLDFTSWQRLTAVFAMYSGARFTVGFRTEGQYRHRGYDLAVTHRSDIHEVENHRSLLRALGIDTGSEPSLTLPPGRLSALAKWNEELIVIHAWPSGTKSFLREWPTSNWLELVVNMNRPDRRFVLTGAPSDRLRTDKLCAEMVKRGVKASVFIGNSGIADVGKLLLSARVLISVNTGIMHLGAILGTPTVSINGPNSQRRWGPRGEKSIGIDTPDGSGGFLNLGFEFRGNPQDAMEKIGVPIVLRAAEELMEARTFSGKEH